MTPNSPNQPAAGELLPCPFCGSHAKVESLSPGWKVVCADKFFEENEGYNCHAASVAQEWEREAEAVAAWNKRGRVTGTYSCPVCGKDSPHQHAALPADPPRDVLVPRADLKDLLNANLEAANIAIASAGGSIDFIEQRGGAESDNPDDQVAYHLFYGLFPAQRLRSLVEGANVAAAPHPSIQDVQGEQEWTDDGLRNLWRGAGGEFHGPHVETGTMAESRLLPFLRSLLGARTAKSVAPSDRDSGEAVAYSVPAQLMTMIWNVIDYYANSHTYRGERIGGVLQGCPRGPDPTPRELTHEARVVLRHLHLWRGYEPYDEEPLKSKVLGNVAMAALQEIKWDLENCDWSCERCGHDYGMRETDIYLTVTRALEGHPLPTPSSEGVSDEIAADAVNVAELRKDAERVVRYIGCGGDIQEVQYRYARRSELYNSGDMILVWASEADLLTYGKKMDAASSTVPLSAEKGE